MEKKILIITPNLNVRSGVTNHIMNYYNEIKKIYKIDFLVYEKTKSEYINKIMGDGNKIYYFNKKIDPSNVEKINCFFRDNSDKYSIVHCHTFNYGFIFLHYAKKYGIKNRIIHIHSIRYSDNFIKHLVNTFLLKFTIKESNYYFACSYDAGKKAYNNKKFYIINNCINLNKYRNVDESIKIKIKKELNINDEFVFGNVGRLVNQKNHKFLLDVFFELKKYDKYKNSKLLIIGDGPKYNDIKKQIDRYNLKKSVIFKSNINNIYDYYNVMNCFIFPSKKEGLGLVLIEAQASQLPCYCTYSLPKEVFISNLIRGLDLKKGAKYWANVIANDKMEKFDVSKYIIDNGFDIEHESSKLIDLYNSML